MTRKFKTGDKVWVKGTVCEIFRPQDDWYYVEIVDVHADEAWRAMAAEDIRPRVKRKKAASPWIPFEQHPQDDDTVLLLFSDGSVALGFLSTTGWIHTSRHREDPTHYMRIPPREVK